MSSLDIIMLIVLLLGVFYVKKHEGNKIKDMINQRKCDRERYENLEQARFDQIFSNPHKMIHEKTGINFYYLDPVVDVSRHVMIRCFYRSSFKNLKCESIIMRLILTRKKDTGHLFYTLDIETHYGTPDWDGKEMHYNYRIEKDEIKGDLNLVTKKIHKHLENHGPGNNLKEELNFRNDSNEA